MDKKDIAPGKLSRREWLRRTSRAGLILPVMGSGTFSTLAAWAQQKPTASPPPTPSPFSKDDDALLEEIEQASFQYFWGQAHPETGIVLDRCNARKPVTGDLGSIAATGFGLTALCIGHKRGYVPIAEAQARVLNTLRFLWKRLTNHRGFYFHFANINNGERLWDSEVSSVDTAILLCGVLTCREYFAHTEISNLALDIFNRVDWNWLSEDTPILPHGWTPEGGFLQYRWGDYSEMMMMYLLGLGSSTHPLPPAAWDAWKRTLFEYDGIRYIGTFAPLFIHQYSQAWFDFRGKRDRYANYFQNSILATDAHRLFCLDLSKQFPDYSNDLWGITASDSKVGYVAWGGPPETGPIDGSVVPCATAGSLPFLPEATMRVQRHIRKTYGDKAWTQYGFVDAFNPLNDWYDTDVVGIDVGISMVMAENARTGFVWETFMKNPEAQRGMDRAGFKPDTSPAPQMAPAVPAPATPAR
jgi:hypothetical protein